MVGASLGRVCYQRGYPARLVFLMRRLSKSKVVGSPIFPFSPSGPLQLLSVTNRGCPSPHCKLQADEGAQQYFGDTLVRSICWMDTFVPSILWTQYFSREAFFSTKKCVLFHVVILGGILLSAASHPEEKQYQASKLAGHLFSFTWLPPKYPSCNWSCIQFTGALISAGLFTKTKIS